VRLQQLFPRIVAADYEQPRRVSEDCRALLRSMLTPDPNRRITIPEIMRHPWCVPPPRGAQAGEQTERPRGAPSGARAQVPDQPGAGQPGAQRPPGAARRADVDADGGRDRVDRGAGDHLRRPDRLGGGRLVRPAPPGRPARAGRARRADTRRAAAQAVVSSAAGPTGGQTGWVARRQRRADAAACSSGRRGRAYSAACGRRAGSAVGTPTRAGIRGRVGRRARRRACAPGERARMLAGARGAAGRVCCRRMPSGCSSHAHDDLQAVRGGLGPGFVFGGRCWVFGGRCRVRVADDCHGAPLAWPGREGGPLSRPACGGRGLSV